MADTNKKRKRLAEATSRPNQKNPKSAPTAVANVRVSLVPETDDWAPVVVSTPGIAIPETVKLQPFLKHRRNATARPGGSGSIATNELLLQSSVHASIDFLGREEEAGGTNSLLKHYIGVYDPMTGDLQVVESRKMTIRGTVRAQHAPEEAMVDRDGSMDLRELRNDLGQTFGTKKARKAIASITENAIRSVKLDRKTSPGGSQQHTKHDAATTALLESMAEATEGMATREELAAVINDAKPIPKANLNAASVQDVYTAQDLIGSEVMRLVPVKSWQDSITATKEVITKSKFVARRLQSAASDVQKLKILRYMLCLLEFIGCTHSKRNIRLVPKKETLKSTITGVPDAVIEHIRGKFSDGREMGKFQSDLLITNVCALALIVDNFEVDLSDLQDDLQLEPKKMTQYFYEIGARVTPATEAERSRLGLDKATAAQHKFARLRLPLQFPKANYARMNRK